MLSHLINKKIIISGISGFLGLHTAVFAQQSGATVVGTDIVKVDGNFLKRQSSIGGHTFCTRIDDLAMTETWREILDVERPDLIIHMAGTTSKGNSSKDWEDCIKGNVNTVSALINAILSQPFEERPIVLYPGTQMEYGRANMPWTEVSSCMPVNSYGATKLAASEILRTTNRCQLIKSVVLRLPIVYGPLQPPTMFFPELLVTLLSGKAFKMTTGKQLRRFLFVRDAARFFLEMGTRLLEGELMPSLINMPASKPIAILEIVKLVSKNLNAGESVQVGAIKLREQEFLDSWPDDSLALGLGFQTQMPLEKGILETISWYRSNRWFYHDN